MGVIKQTKKNGTPNDRTLIVNTSDWCEKSIHMTSDQTPLFDLATDALYYGDTQ